MKLDFQKPPRMAFPFLISVENEVLPEGIEGGRNALMHIISLASLAATVRQRSRYPQHSVCFQSTAGKTTPGGSREKWEGSD